MLIQNAHVVSPLDQLDEIIDVRTEGERVIKVGKALSPLPGEETLDGTGKYLLPGLIDMHVHLRDPGFTYKEDIFTGCAAAAAGGVTGVACMPNTDPVTDAPKTVLEIIEKAKTARARVYPVAAITKGSGGEVLTDMEALREAGAVGVSDDGKPVKNAVLMRAGMVKAEEAGLLPISHCEDIDLIDHGIMHLGAVSKELSVGGMDRASEDSITARELSLAESAGTRIHIAHVSTEGAVGYIRSAKQRGVKATCETAPHYFLLTHEKLRARDADYRMNPPLREQRDVEAIKAAIADGTIDCIITDHAPHGAEEKLAFETAPNGVVGLETSFAASYTGLVKTGILPLSRLVELMSVNPARILNVSGGCIREDGPADLTLVDLDRVWTVEPEKLHSKSKNTVFKGMELTGKPILTICKGTVTYRDGE